MRLATLANGTRDGSLVLVSADNAWALPCPQIASSLLHALEHWDACGPALQALAAGLGADTPGAVPFDPAGAMAPLPRAPQWCDASAFLNHGRLMETAYNTAPIPDIETIPLMYQGASDDFLGAGQDILVRDEAQGIDFEGEYGVIVGEVPMGCTRAEAAAAIRLVVQLNDVSLRAFGPREMRTGFGFLNAKPSTAFAAVAVTPDELGAAWHHCRVALPLEVQWNDTWFGNPDGAQMNFGFDELIVHAAATRRLTAGSIIGSGTVSNQGGAAGSACIAERRAIETIESGQASTRFMRFGDEVRMEAKSAGGAPLFGPIRQRVRRYSKQS